MTCERAAPGSSALLHNMSARPCTWVTRMVPVLRTPWVTFAGPDTPPPLDPSVLARLEARWRSEGLTGAILMHPLNGDLTEHVDPVVCRDKELTLNVLLRTRGFLLLTAMPLLDEPAAAARARLATDDPRLVALALPGDGS